MLERDGWAPYRRFTRAVHQTCLAHLLRRCRELLADAKRGQAKTPHAARRILQAALVVRDVRDPGELDPTQAAVEAKQLGAAVEAKRLGAAVEAKRLGAAVEAKRLGAGQTAYPPNRRLLGHLGRERDALFTHLPHQA